MLFSESMWFNEKNVLVSHSYRLNNMIRKKKNGAKPFKIIIFDRYRGIALVIFIIFQHAANLFDSIFYSTMKIKVKSTRSIKESLISCKYVIIPIFI